MNAISVEVNIYAPGITNSFWGGNTLVCMSTNVYKQSGFAPVHVIWSQTKENSSREALNMNISNVPRTHTQWSPQLYNTYYTGQSEIWRVMSTFTSRRRVEIQTTSEMTPYYFTMTKCNKLFITYLIRSTERYIRNSSLSISSISMMVAGDYVIQYARTV